MDRRGSTVKAFYAVAVLAVLASARINHAVADDASGPSVSSCAYGEPSQETALSAEVAELSRVLFMKLCAQFNGVLITKGSSQSGHLKLPGRITGAPIEDFYPPLSVRLHETGTAVLGLVVESDGRISFVTLLKSTGYAALDNAALAWASHVRFRTPAYLDSIPVRV
jgi:TonB family protein